MSSFEQQEIALLRQQISRMQAQIDQLYRHLDLTFSEDSFQTDDPQVIAALQANNIIEAIKFYREKTGLGLAEAKSAVEAIKKRRGI
jgi:ribosomal protein L7/L12